MKRIVFYFSAVLLFLFSLQLFAEGIRESAAKPQSGEGSRPSEKLSSSSSPAAGSSVWKVTKDGNTLFFGGSVHILREKDFPLPEEFDYAFSRSKILVLETDTDQLTEPEIMQYLLSQMILPDDVTVESLLDAETYYALSLACDEYGYSIEDAEKIKPSMIINMLLVLQIQKLGFVQQGIDDYYQIKAQNDNMPVKFLEPVQTQIDMLVTMGEGYENEYVSYSLKDMENTETSLETMMREWRYGTTGANEEALIDMRDNWPKLYKALITDRHNEWMPQIKEFFSTGQVHFIIAGLLHMHGPDGLLRQLEDLGYKAEKVIIRNF